MKRIARIAVLAVASGCGSSLPPQELGEARVGYWNAANGAAAHLAPVSLHNAKKSLDKAEQSFDERGESTPTKDLAYVAGRKAQLAEATARALQAEKDRESAERDARNMLVVGGISPAVERERRDREETEKLLTQIASVEQDARGIVVALDAGELFASGQTTLPPASTAKLKDVAAALANGASDSVIVVEGHVDSDGVNARGMELSQKRADAVREVLVANGLADRIKSVGAAPKSPVVDAAKAENRATKPRIEIIIQNGKT